mmetsp:Transcript_3822/g.7963  ORF Transcript_3822/g.7963 Transcript_3822/m.7963 type:complete len:85 (+) Transcript_3822:1858-2112(+)
MHSYRQIKSKLNKILTTVRFDSRVNRRFRKSWALIPLDNIGVNDGAGNHSFLLCLFRRLVLNLLFRYRPDTVEPSNKEEWIQRR